MGDSVLIQIVRGWYCPECGTFNVIDGSIVGGGGEDTCEDCGCRVTVLEVR